MFKSISISKNRILATLTIFTMILATSVFINPQQVSAATNYYVDGTNGNDSNEGTSPDTAFKTIQKAASLATAGSTVYIRAGTYRETVTPAYSGTEGNNITFQNYNGETVKVSGCDLVTGWTQYSGSIYWGNMNWNYDSGYGNMVYVDGNLMIEARWPNISNPEDVLVKSNQALAESATTGTTTSTISNSSLSAFPDDYWNGALVWCANGVEYFGSVAAITDFTSSSGTISHNPWWATAPWYNTNCVWNGGPNNRFFIFRSLNALDVEKEWYVDSTNSRLYIRVPGSDNPTNHVVEAKKREATFDVSGKSYISIKGMTIYGATIKTNDNTTHCTFDSLTVNGTDLYLKHGTMAGGQQGDDESGIILNGSYNALKNSEIKLSGGTCVLLKGTYNSVVNNDIHHTNMFGGGYQAGIKAAGKYQLISNNTVNDTGRACILADKLYKSQIQYNNLYNAVCLTDDSGFISSGMTDFGGTRIHHNYIHDSQAIWRGGIYTDGESSNAVIYDNVVWNLDSESILIGYNNMYSSIFNNTTVNNRIWNESIMGEKFYNNILGYWDSRSSVAKSSGNNIVQEGDIGYSNYANNDFSLQASSPAIDAGVVIPGITDGFSGIRPDIGAYEYGSAGWTAGHNFANPPDPSYQFNELSFMNRVNNYNYEYGLTDWTLTGNGQATTVTGNSWDYDKAGIVASCYKAASIPTGSGIEQTVTGLKPNTKYLFNGNIKTDGLFKSASQYSAANGSLHWNKTRDGVSLPTYRSNNYVGPMQNDDWLKFSSIDFGTNIYNRFAAGLVNSVSGGTIEIRTDSPTGTLLGTLSIVDNNSSWTFQSTSLSAQSGVHDLYLVFKGTGNITFFDSFKLFNSTMSDSVVAGVKNYGGPEKSVSINNQGNWVDNNLYFSFITGPTDTSATIYVKKDSGSYVGYADKISVWQQNYTPSTLFNDSFDSGFLNWNQGYGTPSMDTTSPHGGTSSYICNEDTDVIHKDLGTSYNKVARVWFYDSGASASETYARLDSGAWNDTGSWRGLGVNTSLSSSYYVYRVGTTETVTSIARSTGWHEFRWDYSSGSGVDMYIDNKKVATAAGTDSFNMVAMGDWWGDTQTGNNKFDDFEIMDDPLGHEDFEAGLEKWMTGMGTANTSIVQKHSGDKSYVTDEGQDVIWKKSSTNYSGKYRIWFYDDSSDTSLASFARVDSGTFNDSSSWRGLGVDTDISSNCYIYRLGMNEYATPVIRSTGWHELKWDYSSGYRVDMYIDGTLVASPAGITTYNMVAMGNWWGGNYSGTCYFDDAGDVQDISEGFEGSPWSAYLGTPATSTVQKHSGCSSYVTDETQDSITKTLSFAATNINVWFYDIATYSNTANFLLVDDGDARRGLGVDTGISSSFYVYRVSNNEYATSLIRSTGWHLLSLQYDSSGVSMYIDGNLAASAGGSTSCSKIYLGDPWGVTSGPHYYDDFSASNSTQIFSDGFEEGLYTWSAIAGIPTISSVQKHSGNSSYVTDDIQDGITKTLSFAATNISVWFYDISTYTNAVNLIMAGDGTSRRGLGVDTGISGSYYVYKVGDTEYASTIPRSTGWHKLSFKYYDNGVNMYIDGNLAANATGSTSSSTVYLGDPWGGTSGPLYYDDFYASN